MQDQYYFVSPENTKIGPIPWTVLEQMHAARTINDETLTAPEGASEWFRFQDLKKQRATPDDSREPRSNPGDSDFKLHGFLEGKAERLKSLIPDDLLTKVREKKSVIVVRSVIIVLVALGGYLVLGFLDGEDSYSDYEEETSSHWGQNDPSPAAPAFPQFNPNMPAQEYNDFYARPGSSVQGGTLNRGSGTTQDSMDSAMKSAANTFGSGGTPRQTYQPPPPQNKPAALSTYGAKPKRYRNFRGEVREFIGIPPSGWTALND